MKLCSLPLSPFAARVRAAIYAKGLDIEIVTPSPDWRQTGEIKRLNPMGRIPVLLLDDGTALPESQVIVDYLDATFPQKPMLPKDPLAAAKVRVVIQVIDAYVSPALWPIFSAFDAKTGIDPEKGKPLFAALMTALGQLEAVLDDGPYARSGTLGMADFALTPLRFNLQALAGMTGKLEILGAHPRIDAYTKTVAADPTLSRIQGELSAALEKFMKAFKETGDPLAASKQAAKG